MKASESNTNRDQWIVDVAEVANNSYVDKTCFSVEGEQTCLKDDQELAAHLNKYCDFSYSYGQVEYCFLCKAMHAIRISYNKVSPQSIILFFYIDGNGKRKLCARDNKLKRITYKEESLEESEIWFTSDSHFYAGKDGRLSIYNPYENEEKYLIFSSQANGAIQVQIEGMNKNGFFLSTWEIVLGGLLLLSLVADFFPQVKSLFFYRLFNYKE